MKAMLRTSLTESFHADLSVATFPGIASTLLQRAFIPLSVIGGLTGLLTLSVHLFVTKLGFSLEKLTPDFGRFSPVSKIKNMAFQGPMALLQASAMLVLFAMVIVFIARQNADLLLTLPFMSLDSGLLKVGGIHQGHPVESGGDVSGVRLDRFIPPETQIHEGPPHEQARGQSRNPRKTKEARSSRARSGACSAISPAAA